MKIERIYDAANEQANCLNAVADPKATKALIASCYADCIRAGEGVDFPVVNKAIIERHGLSGLAAIKKMAHKEVKTGKPAFVK